MGSGKNRHACGIGRTRARGTARSWGRSSLRAILARLSSSDRRKDRPMPEQPTPTEREAMARLIAKAKEAAQEPGKAGIAAAILRDGEIIAEGENEVHLDCDPTRHAEIVAIAKATRAQNDPSLDGCVLLTTLQPCEMCLSAARFAGITRIIFGAQKENVAGKYFVFPDLTLSEFRTAGGAFEAIGGVLEEDVVALYADGEE
ncbi:hypothetical protein B6V76_07550 [Thioclava sp. IC9]|nr:hypothetical protein B6V76_07550 [Thioclava sp. IC9]OWY05884.1 hypothetical protein B6V75_07215 [Thioclava sp. F1Mire-8]